MVKASCGVVAPMSTRCVSPLLKLTSLSASLGGAHTEASSDDASSTVPRLASRTISPIFGSTTPRARYAYHTAAPRLKASVCGIGSVSNSTRLDQASSEPTRSE